VYERIQRRDEMMVDAAIERQLVACLAGLPPADQRQVLAFAQNLQNRSRALGGSGLVHFAGAIEATDLDTMSAAIEADCEKVDADEW
jgi:hypothetical protein